MAHREAAARKALPKTGIDVIDAEAVVVQACLGRIQDTISAEARAAARKKPAVTRVIPVPGAASSAATPQTIDISHRTQMGPLPPQTVAPDDDDSTLVERTDAIVAQSALQRLMGIVASIGAELAVTQRTATEATARATALTERVAVLERIVAEQAAKLEQQDDPKEAFHKYRQMWTARHAERQGTLAADYDVRRQAIAHLLERRAANAAAAKLVRERRRALKQRTDEEENAPNAAKEQEEIDAIMKGFAPLPISVVVEGQGTAAPVFQLKSLRAAATLGAGTTAASRTGGSTSVLGASSAGQDPVFLSASLRTQQQPQAAADSSRMSPAGTALSPTAAPHADGDEDDGTLAGSSSALNNGDAVLDNVDLLLEGDDINAFVRATHGGLGSASADSPHSSSDEGPDGGMSVKKEVRADELLVTRFLDTSNTRTVARMDPSATFIGVLLSALRFAPSEYIVLVLDPDALAGRRAALGRQAAVAGISSFWDEVAQCTVPVVYIAQCNPPAVPVTSPLAFAGQPPSTTASDEMTTLVSGRYIASQFERDEPGASESKSVDSVARRVVEMYRSDEALRRPEFNPIRAPRDPVRSQHPGIISVLSRGDVAGETVDLIATGILRCYASSMLLSCKVDAIVTPFYDLHSPYFSTRDEPDQFISVIFDKIAITPLGYSFACTHPTSGGFYPRNWCLEASLDGTNWSLLSRHVNDSTLSRYTPTGWWPIKAPPGTYFSEFRIRHEGYNALNTRHLNVSSFELYGRAMYVRERRRVDQKFLPAVPRTYASAAVRGRQAGGVGYPPRSALGIPLFDEPPPEPAAKKGKASPKKKK
jgi:hypothetical protein